MVEHRVVRNLEDIILQFLQAMYAHNLGLGFGVAEDEVAKAHVFFHHTAQVETHLLRVFIDKAEALGLGTLTVFALRAFHDKRHILVAATYGAQQFKARLGSVYQESPA